MERGVDLGNCLVEKVIVPGLQSPEGHRRVGLERDVPNGEAAQRIVIEIDQVSEPVRRLLKLAGGDPNLQGDKVRKEPVIVLLRHELFLLAEEGFAGNSPAEQGIQSVGHSRVRARVVEERRLNIREVLSQPGHEIPLRQTNPRTLLDKHRIGLPLIGRHFDHGGNSHHQPPRPIALAHARSKSSEGNRFPDEVRRVRHPLPPLHGLEELRPERRNKIFRREGAVGCRVFRRGDQEQILRADASPRDPDGQGRCVNPL